MNLAPCYIQSMRVDEPSTMPHSMRVWMNQAPCNIQSMRVDEPSTMPH